MNKTEIANLLALCASAYPHVAITKETAVVYAEMLADLELSVAMQAVKKLIATSQYFPTVAAIREQAASISRPFAPSLARAWAEVTYQVRHIGHGRQPEWSHPSIALTVDTLGWRELCMSENQAVLRAHFWKVYEAVARDQRLDSILPPEPKRLGPS